MGKISFQDGVAIALLVFYVVCLPLSIWISLRHGLAKASGWVFLVIFAVIRIISASSQLATISQGPLSTAAEVAGITSAVGTSALLLSTLGLISRLYNSFLKSPWNMLFSFFLLRAIQTPCGIGLVLCIVGATQAANFELIYQQTLLRVGVILFVVVAVVLALLYAIGAIIYRKTGKGERPLVIALAIALPLLISRVAFSLALCFGTGHVFTSSSDKEYLTLFLADIEEMAVTLTYIVAGVRMSSVPKEEGQGQGSRLAYRTQRGDFGGGRAGLITLALEVLGGSKRKERRNVNSDDIA